MAFEAGTAEQIEQLGRPRSLIGRAVARAIPALDAGQLRLVLPNGEAIAGTGKESGPEAVLFIKRWRALWRMLRSGEHGFTDGYIDGDWTTPDLG